AAPAAGPTQVSIVDFAFEEQMLQVPVGTTVEWVNNDSFAHSVVADDGSFRSENLAAGATFSFTFDAVGTFDYICGIHPSMLGTIVVTG
ncbi:MAG: cupredoxin family copper-binding protein, partial [Actinomycetota bacterium]|nr:cupredoxin family copper-binding protein [Actinomycetota bacterium]